MAKNDVIVELKNIRKEFPGVVALNHVNLTLRAGRVHALVGENGAGKSTLMKILSGTYASYGGEVLLDGKSLRFAHERDALDKGIAIVPQELNPIPEMTIAENIFLGREPMKRKGIINRKERSRLTKDYLASLGLDYDPETKMWKLSVAQRQMVEIIKAISRNSRVIIMDEPTSALTGVETRQLFAQIEMLKQKGIAIVFISHKLDEVYAIGDDVTVLRDGEMISTGLLKDVTQDHLIAMMVGREVKDIYPPLPVAGSEPLLIVKGLSSKDVFEDVSFEIHKGEIVGFAGMMGAGRSEIARAVFGLDRHSSGTIIMDGKTLRIKSPRDAIKNSIAMVTEDRAAYGFVGVRSIKDNIVLPNCDLFSKHGILNVKTIKAKVTDICRKLSVKAASIETLAGTLSGGNQQKLVLSKWLVRNVKLLILDEPTRGIDVGAKQEIYRLIAELAASGIGVLLIASEMPEVLSMSHRVEVITNGHIIGELSRAEATQDKVMKMIVEGRKHNGE
ncbi:MAG: sugar ABC transporter ATP-binding protein [Eubacteriales bacterium]|nr:sugar ABC transporter ATP-binding protein [Eubacteriales bacterium]